ncbi:hypothetical protein KXW38_000574, partial [Aspergillus fumigatus]
RNDAVGCDGASRFRACAQLSGPVVNPTRDARLRRRLYAFGRRCCGFVGPGGKGRRCNLFHPAWLGCRDRGRAAADFSDRAPHRLAGDLWPCWHPCGCELSCTASRVAKGASGEADHFCNLDHRSVRRHCICRALVDPAHERDARANRHRLRAVWGDDARRKHL